jgi:predicted alpha/beta hydrolase family esterase
VSERRFLILHGWEGSGPGHWQSWLAERLHDAGEAVRFPVLPDADWPRPEDWERALRDELGALGYGADGAERVVLCHSLACLLWLRHAVRPVGPPVDRVLLVAPPSPRFDGPPGWANPPLDAAAVARAAKVTRLACGDDDPYCPEGAHHAYAEPLGIDADVLPRAGHVNADSGFGPWPAVEEWAYGAKNGVET